MIGHFGSFVPLTSANVPVASATMYAAYQSGQLRLFVRCASHALHELQKHVALRRPGHSPSRTKSLLGQRVQEAVL